MKEQFFNDLFEFIFNYIEKNKTPREVENDLTVPMGSYFKCDGDGELYVLKIKTCNLIDNRHVKVEYDETKKAVTIEAHFTYEKEVEPYSDYSEVMFDWYITKPLPEDAAPETLTAEVKNGVVTIAAKKRTASYSGDKEHSSTIKIKRLKS